MKKTDQPIASQSQRWTSSMTKSRIIDSVLAPVAFAITGASTRFAKLNRFKIP